MRGVGLTLHEHRCVQVMRHRRCTSQRQTGHHRQNRSESHGGDEAQEDVAAHCVRQVDSGHIAAALQTLGQIAIDVVGSRILRQQNNSAKTDDEGQDVEVTDPGRCPTHGLAGFLGARHSEEAHQNVRQTRRTEHQRHTDRDGRNRILDQSARRHDRIVLGVDFNSLGEQRLGVETELIENGQSHEGCTDQ